MRKYEILHSIIINDEKDWRDEVQLCWVPELKKPQIRICYYTKQNRNGTEFWNIAPRPLSFDFEAARRVTKAINDLTNLYTKIEGTIKK